MRKILLVVLALLTLVANLVLVPNRAVACSCSGPLTAQEALNAVDVVYFGEVMTIRQHGEVNTITLKVMSTWKGTQQPEIAIDTFSYGCGLRLEVGEHQILYASYGSDGILFTNSCIYYRPDYTKADLQELGSGTPPLSQEIIDGQIKLHQEQVADSRGWAGYAEEGAITILGGLAMIIFAACLISGIALLIWLAKRLRYPV
jgi:hypothetical protein